MQELGIEPRSRSVRTVVRGVGGEGLDADDVSKPAVGEGVNKPGLTRA
jgi:hypothetical protein